MENILLEFVISYILGECHLVIILSKLPGDYIPGRSTGDYTVKSCSLIILLKSVIWRFIPGECHLVIIFLEIVIW